MPGTSPRTVVLWGNCQAAPLADLLAEPLAERGMRLVKTPPVYLMSEVALQQAQAAVATAAFLISQPVTDNYRLAGCGTKQLAAHLSPHGQLLTLPVLFHVGAYPCQVHGHGAGGERVDAPVTDYHDLRAMVAAERRMSVEEAVAWWPKLELSAVREVADLSQKVLQTREAGTDLAVSSVLDGPDALWTMSHPTNRALVQVAKTILEAMGIRAGVASPDREYLGAKRAPLEQTVVEAHGWPASAARSDWTIDGSKVTLEEVLTSQLNFYRSRADVVADGLFRYRERVQLLGLQSLRERTG